ncbi:DNA (cytosine-5)-methyltransferase DRM2 [Acorus calamus]|uniref:DNA (cytosine-5-)-methyltransferase n=1 Tax=Acorus calamus TaxID=4465 RepID=A0AAV9DDX5_ACOCL|nr:DNA (cytosine-5)-methyltransferase DRM2 [Acorus calamus]
MDWTDDSEDDDNISWESDEEAKPENSGPPPATNFPTVEQEDHAGPSRVSPADPSRSKLISHFVGMGFAEDMVTKVIDENGERDVNTLLETLLTYKVIGTSTSSPRSSNNEKKGPDDDFSDISNVEFSDADYVENEIEDEDISEERKLLTLVEMGFSKDEAASAVGRCGQNASILEIADSIHAAQLAEGVEGPEEEFPWTCWSEDESTTSFIFGASTDKKRIRRWSDIDRRKRMKMYSQGSRNEDDEDLPSLSLPNPMIGFGLPNGRPLLTHRKLPEAAMGPPYFYYENVALAPRGVWDTISRFLYDIEPEFVDSKFFCAAARKRGYIHNLPIHNRFPLLPLPPRTIFEAFPMTKKWWPSWDTRTHLNCLQTCTASAKLTERIRSALADSDDPPSHNTRQFVINECRKWNLVWVGLHKVAPLEPDEIEMLLGFPRNHTRGGGSSRTERYKSLGNSFQVDTVAYHLSVLKDMFPNGITMLSLFSGIGGAEVALHRLGIHLKAVVSVEISEVNRNIVRSWWEQTNQTGTLIDIADVQQLNGDKIEQLIHTFGGFDLVVGGSPCNNLAGSNRVSRDGLEGKHSALFYDYFRILDLVKNIMGKES